jgi:hypothetical protein
VEHKGDVIRSCLFHAAFALFSIASGVRHFGSGVSRLEYALFFQSPASRTASGRPLVLREAVDETTCDQIFREDD